MKLITAQDLTETVERLSAQAAMLQKMFGDGSIMLTTFFEEMTIVEGLCINLCKDLMVSEQSKSPTSEEEVDIRLDASANYLNILLLSGVNVHSLRYKETAKFEPLFQALSDASIAVMRAVKFNEFPIPPSEPASVPESTLADPWS